MATHNHNNQPEPAQYYTLNGIKYIQGFPREWAEEHVNEEHAGPRKCGNCLFYGTFRSIFVGYCSTCAAEYDFERGNGFEELGRECPGDPNDSAWNTYLENVELNNLYNPGWDLEMRQILQNIYNFSEEYMREFVYDYQNSHNNYIGRYPLVLNNGVPYEDNEDYESENDEDTEEIEDELPELEEGEIDEQNEVPEIPELTREEKDIRLIENHAGVSEDVARAAYIENKEDIVDAIIALTT
jgi:NACalpha-BTF3-like transcription factor